MARDTRLRVRHRGRPDEQLMALLPLDEYRKNGKPQIQAQGSATFSTETEIPGRRELVGPFDCQWAFSESTAERERCRHAQDGGYR
jgi:hypothetical protein